MPRSSDRKPYLSKAVMSPNQDQVPANTRASRRPPGRDPAENITRLPAGFTDIQTVDEGCVLSAIKIFWNCSEIMVGILKLLQQVAMNTRHLLSSI